MKDHMTNNTFYPTGISSSGKLTKITLSDKKKNMSERLSTRLVKCASVLDKNEFVGWQMFVPTKGLIDISLFGSSSVSSSDLEWMAEKTGVISKGKNKNPDIGKMKYLYEIFLPVAEQSRETSIGFGTALTSVTDDDNDWPMYYSSQWKELVQALRQTGGMFRVVIGPADKEAQNRCRRAAIKTFRSHEINANDYIGTPVCMRILMLLPCEPTIRLRSILNEAMKAASIRCLGNTEQAEIAETWDTPLKNAPVLPDYAARIMMLEPDVNEPVIGINTYMESVKKIPARHKNSKSKKAVTIGKATDITGVSRKITIGELDLKRHYQIVGQTGTGKSTLLSTVILSAIEQGHGLTFFDPHGSTIDTVLHSLPEKYADRVRVVRIGDAANPVPLNIWDSDDPVKEERNIADLCELFGDIFNPPDAVFVGPRYERWLSIFAKASIAFLGKRASLESIAVISQSKNNMKKVSDRIRDKYPELAESIKQEYGLDNSNDFQGTLSWYLCKFQRLTSVEQLRKTLGAGANALDFRHSIDTDTVTLVDLASPVIGTHAARVIGTLMMMKLWNAAMARKERDRTHLVVVDEAALFQTNPMPRMLAEARKFGISMVLCHQHTGQLSQPIRDSLEANSANFSAFRLSPKDAAHAAIRFDDAEMQTKLARLDAFNAITTLSVDGSQTEPFTLETIVTKKQKNGDEIAAKIEAESIRKLVEPYRKLRALTPAEIVKLLNNEKDEEKPIKAAFSDKNEVITDTTVPRWLNKWKNKRDELQSA